MQGDATHVVLLSGGSGTRLWPLSNSVRPKQFLKVLRDDQHRPESMVQRTVRLVRGQNPGVTVTVATSDEQVEILRAQLTGDYGLSIEPQRRDTAPAIMLAAAHVASSQGAHKDAVVVVMPIDTFADAQYYANVSRLSAAVRAGEADLVLLGVEPSYPSTKYGYIVPEDLQGDVRRVKRFTEKPDEPTACYLISQGALWNCGVFAFRLGWLLEIVGRYCDADGYESLRERYAELPKNSFDYEVVERATSVAVIPYAGTWKDLGTWDALCEELHDPVAGRVTVDETTANGVHVINETDLPVVVAGVQDVVVVVTDEGVLVTGKEESERIKDLVRKVV